jgi:Rps23 Pro-64 3,4-dihydroxylase Tpa1-like proline 4-hydroxylase
MELNKMFINLDNLNKSLKKFKSNAPFDHCVIDDFLLHDYALKIEEEFPNYNDDKFFVYDNALEHKKTLNNWNSFPKNTYKLFEYLVSTNFTDMLSKRLNLILYPDPGLHGGGWHIHGEGGNLNPHLDYSIHPKSGLMRKLNIIIYLSRDLLPCHGGQLGLYKRTNSDKYPLSLEKEIELVFNRAIIFDTTQDSWHGMSRPLSVPAGVYRKSLAAYYLTLPTQDCDQRNKALYAPREEQFEDKYIAELITNRADGIHFSTSYIKK